MASKKVNQNRIKRYIERLKEDNIIYPNLIVTKDNLEDNVPYMQVQTDYQNINVIINDDTVICTTRMRKGAGTEKEFTKKVEALNNVRKYVKRKFKGDEYQIKESLNNIKVTSIDTIYTLTYDFATNEIVTKTRARRGTKNNDKKIINKLVDITVPEIVGSKEQADKSKHTAVAEMLAPKELNNNLYICDGLTTLDIHFAEENEYEEWPQGTIVANIYSEKHYTVQQDMRNVIEVSSAESGYQTMARADLRKVV